MNKILYTVHPKNLTINLLELIKEFIKVAGYKNLLCFYLSVYLFWRFFKKFIWDQERERGRENARAWAGKEGQREREKKASPGAGSLIWDLIPVPWDHDLSQSKYLTYWATQVPHVFLYTNKKANSIYNCIKKINYQG